MASKGIRYSEEQIIRILKELETGTAIAEICRRYGGSRADSLPLAQQVCGLGNQGSTTVAGT